MLKNSAQSPDLNQAYRIWLNKKNYLISKFKNVDSLSNESHINLEFIQNTIDSIITFSKSKSANICLE